LISAEIRWDNPGGVIRTLHNPIVPPFSQKKRSRTRALFPFAPRMVDFAGREKHPSVKLLSLFKFAVIFQTTL
jgi:hypothetical protein